MNKGICSFFVASCTVLAASSAWACEPMHRGQSCGKYFQEMDANKDGAISKKEFNTFHGKHFQSLDSNRDGKLTQEEMQAAYPGKMHERGDELINKRFDASDLDHDGGLTRDEAKNMPMLSQHFDEIDTNKDSKVTQEELKVMMEQNRAARGPGNTAPEKK